MLDTDDALDALIASGKMAELTFAVADRLARWSRKDRADLGGITRRIHAGDTDLAVAFPFIDLAAAVHAVWEDGYETGRASRGG